MDFNLYYLECKRFFRSGVTIGGIAILFISSFAGMYFGKTFLDKQKAVISKLEHLGQTHLLDDIKCFGDDLGNLMYHHEFITYHNPNNWIAFSMGQRDVHPFIMPITMLALEGQRYDGELTNPVSLLLGNMDVAFVFILLFPLIIIAFTYNLLSSEKESLVWPMVKIQSFSVMKVLLMKFSIRIFTIYATVGLIFLIAGFYLQLPFDKNMWIVADIIFLYILFWFSLVFWIISLNKASNVNAVLLLAVWVVLNILMPAVLNVVVTHLFPVSEALDTVVQQRESYHEKWDKDKNVALDKFFEHYPQLKKYNIRKDIFTWGWYYAMQQMGDDESEKQSNELFEKLKKRQNWTTKAALFIPSVNTQLQLNKVAHTDLESHTNYLSAIKDYHEKIRTYFYPFIFEEAPVSAVRWSDFPLFNYENNNRPDVSKECLAIFSWAVIFNIFALIRIRKVL